MSFRARCLAAVLFGAVLAGCGSTATPSPSAQPSASGQPPSAPPTPGVGEVVAAPGSDSSVYEPNPGAIVVAIDPGHGGCLDWGVPNPWDNTVSKAEKADTLAIGLALRELLQAQGITVVMTRTDDSALAGDDYPQLGCNGPAWRDVDGDGEAGFEESGRTRTRDELQARIDLANLARAELQEATGVAPAFAIESFSDLDADVRQSILRVRRSPFLAHRDVVRGFVYDVDDYRLREVEPG